MTYEEDRKEALRRAKSEGRTVDIGKAVAHMNRKPLDYAGEDLGEFPVNVFVGDHEASLRVGKAEVTIKKNQVEKIKRQIKED